MEKITAFIKKLKLWKRKINEADSKDAFPILQQFSCTYRAKISLYEYVSRICIYEYVFHI